MARRFELVVEAHEQSAEALRFVGLDDGGARRETVEIVETAAAAGVDGVDVGGRIGLDRGDGDGSQRRGQPAAVAATEQDVAAVPGPAQRELALAVGIVDQAQHAAAVAGTVVVVAAARVAEPWIVHGDDVGQRRAPWSRWRRRIPAAGRIDDGTHDRRQLGRTACALEREVLVGAEAQDRPAGSPPWDRDRADVADDIERIGAVRQAQRAADVRVGADVVAEDAAGALRGQQQVDAEAAAALGDADERVQERRPLGDQRGKLVDHDHESRQCGGDGAQAAQVGDVVRSQHGLPAA
ncbi:MAG: hypothetical protein QM733_05870 [Ilumatobacteraceae bacterium]